MFPAVTICIDFSLSTVYKSRLHVLVYSLSKYQSDIESIGLSYSFFQYPGWTLTPEGSLLMAKVNDDATGLYACTPYNSYGSKGPSGPTSVILQVSDFT